MGCCPRDALPLTRRGPRERGGSPRTRQRSLASGASILLAQSRRDGCGPRNISARAEKALSTISEETASQTRRRPPLDDYYLGQTRYSGGRHRHVPFTAWSPESITVPSSRPCVLGQRLRVAQCPAQSHASAWGAAAMAPAISLRRASGTCWSFGTPRRAKMRYERSSSGLSGDRDDMKVDVAMQGVFGELCHVGLCAPRHLGESA